MKKFLKENGLSLILFALFFIFLAGLSVTGYKTENEELSNHHQPNITYMEYVRSGSFIEAVFENWESEFLQMGALVVLTIWFFQKGSADSKKLRGKNDVDTSSRYSIIGASNWSNRRKAVVHVVYANSLSSSLFGLFFGSFILHALGGASAVNQEAVLHGGTTMSVAAYVRSSQFWYESFQNWQSEFLAVGTLLILSIYLRQRKSPESKPIGQSNKRTGS